MTYREWFRAALAEWPVGLALCVGLIPILSLLWVKQ